jgi:hypothetical protein
MIDLKLNGLTKDLEIQDFDLQLIDETDQIAQNLLIRLRFMLGEWYLDITAGIPYYQDILIKSPNQFRVESVIKEEIVNTEGVREITSFISEYSASNRRFSIQFSCQTDDDSQINLELEL